MITLRIITAFILLISTAAPGWVIAQTTETNIKISEILTSNGEGLADQEFIELYNPTDEAVDLTGWRLEYKSASGENWLNRVDSTESTLSGTIQPRGFFLAATESYQEAYPELDYGATLNDGGLASSGGHIRLAKPTDDPGVFVTADLLGWGTADSPEEAALDPEPAPGESAKRLFNEEGEIIDTDNNSNDFMVSDSPSPRHTPALDSSQDEEEPEETEDPSESSDPDETTYLSLEISELLPDPVSPYTDSEDEFVELYNPHSTSVNLGNYIIKTGSNLQYSFTLPPVTVPAKGYKTFYAHEGSMTLANSGSRVQLLDPGGATASGMVKYEKAPPGQSWSKINESWIWTSIVTPNAVNQASTNTEEVEEESSSAGVARRTIYPKIIITELLPDPASPERDAADEFVEIYNPNTTAVELDGYVLRTGSTLKTKYNLPGVVIEPREYMVFFSDSAKISLTNSGGNAQLEGEDGQVISKPETYPKAKTGASWALKDGKWQWSSTPTPGAINTISAVPEKSASNSSVTNSRSGAGNPASTPATVLPNATSNALAVGSGVAALGYALYEFRFDIRNRWRLLKQAKIIKGFDR